jgi:hypothetical protein
MLHVYLRDELNQGDVRPQRSVVSMQSSVRLRGSFRQSETLGAPIDIFRKKKKEKEIK